MKKKSEPKQFIESVGIDVSKLTLDVFLYNKKQHQVFPNSQKGFIAVGKWIKSELGNSEDILYCFEHTGWYCILLSHFLHDQSKYYCAVLIHSK